MSLASTVFSGTLLPKAGALGGLLKGGTLTRPTSVNVGDVMGGLIRRTRSDELPEYEITYSPAGVP
jgi:hypothetical protein